MEKDSLPSNIKRLFWELDPEKLNIKTNSSQIIVKILEYGGLTQVHWMMRVYSGEDIIEILKSSRQLSKKSANFWANYYKVPINEVRCLNKSFLAIHKSIWPY